MRFPLFPSLPRAAALAILLSASAFANDRHFGYAYETRTLPQGARELEVWTTARAFRTNFYSALDHRLEFETGMTDRLQTSFYLNWQEITTDTGGGNLATSLDWDGISTEFKYKLSDPTADALGSALYAEFLYNTSGFEIEGKVLFDKQAGDWLLAANLITEFEYALGAAETELAEIGPAAVLAAAYQFSPAFSLGAELRNHSPFMRQSSGDMKLAYSALFLGPTVAYRTQSWWLTFTALPQIPGFKTSGSGNRELHDHEGIEGRLLFSLHL